MLSLCLCLESNLLVSRLFFCLPFKWAVFFGSSSASFRFSLLYHLLSVPRKLSDLTATQPRRCPRPQHEGCGGRLRRRLRRVRRIPARPRRPPVRGQPRGTNSPVIQSHDETSNQFGLCSFWFQNCFGVNLHSFHMPLLRWLLLLIRSICNFTYIILFEWPCGKLFWNNYQTIKISVSFERNRIKVGSCFFWIILTCQAHAARNAPLSSLTCDRSRTSS